MMDRGVTETFNIYYTNSPVSSDLQSDFILSQRNKECNSLCEEGRNCCDKFAYCTCGANTGVNACTCRKGFYGSGLKGDCKRKLLLFAFLPQTK